MLFNFITLAIGTFALAAAAEDTCISDTKYRLDMFDSASNTLGQLHAIDNGPAGSVILVADPELDAPGTPIHETGGAGTTNIILDLTDGPLTTQSGSFMLSVADLGERYGASAPVIGTKDASWPHWYATTEMVWPQQTAASQVFFACDVTINGKTYKALSWGLMGSDGSLPQGCAGTIVGKRFDVPC